MTSVERIKSICKERHIPIMRLEQACGFSNGYFRKLKRGTLPDDRLFSVAEFLGLSPEFLSTGSDSPDAVRIPVLGRVAAGIPLKAITDITDYEEISPRMVRGDSEFYGLEIKGNSMEPRIREGDHIIFRAQSDAETGDIVVVMVNGEDATCKKLRKYDHGIDLISLNPVYEPMYFSNEQIEQLPVKIIGKVVELRGKF